MEYVGECKVLQSACFFFKLCVFLILDLNIDQEYNIYYCQSTKWIALGKFDQAIKDDNECEWGYWIKLLSSIF